MLVNACQFLVIQFLLMEIVFGMLFFVKIHFYQDSLSFIMLTFPIMLPIMDSFLLDIYYLFDFFVSFLTFFRN